MTSRVVNDIIKVERVAQVGKEMVISMNLKVTKDNPYLTLTLQEPS